jgi:biopolymer transport protein ExbD
MPLKVSHDELPAINLTPMIDIVFNLIIFFMVSTSFADAEKSVDLTVPQVAGATGLADSSPHKAINVHRDGHITLDAQTVSLPELTARLATARREHERLDVVVRGDADSPFQHVAAVFTACRQAGISEMGISVRLGSKQPGTQER